MKHFLVICSGQLLSGIGSMMTFFALTIWAWEKTGSASALAFISFFFLAPTLLTGLFTGIIVDRFNRKLLIILGDAVTGLMSVILFLIYVKSILEIWHLYLLVTLISPFAQLQSLASETIVKNLVSEQNYSRAGALISILGYGPQIIAPGLAGFLYPLIGLEGILMIDLVSFLLAIFTLIITPITSPSPHLSSVNFWENFTISFDYLGKNKQLLNLIIIEILFWFIHDVGGRIMSPLILTRTDGDTVVLGSVSMAAGIGGVTGGIIITIWGGIKNKIKGLFLGMTGAGICKIIFSFGQSFFIWLPAQFLSSNNFPLIYSSRQSYFLETIEPDIQGRIFALRNWLRQGVGTIASLIAGFLADEIFEPLMMRNNILTPLFGNSKGAGISLLYFLTSVGLLLIGLMGFYLNQKKLE